MYYKKVNDKEEVIEVMTLDIDELIEESNHIEEGFRLERIEKDEYDKLFDEIEKENNNSTNIPVYTYLGSTMNKSYSDVEIRVTVLNSFSATGEIPPKEKLEEYFKWIKGVQ